MQTGRGWDQPRRGQGLIQRPAELGPTLSGPLLIPRRGHRAPWNFSAPHPHLSCPKEAGSPLLPGPPRKGAVAQKARSSQFLQRLPAGLRPTPAGQTQELLAE